ncbi:MAG TPA: PepSY domain-containing protein [Gammaproteobacteria bacterium]|nr:PepSY domain-containing protein [Gammaproteobacteria bacterium]
MNSKVLSFSVIALAGTAGLLAVGLLSNGTGDGEHGDTDDDVHEMREHAAVRSLAGSGDILSLEQILLNARRQHAGRVLETELEDKGGVPVYEVEILDAGGEVWEMKFDARSGELIEEEQED